MNYKTGTALGRGRLMLTVFVSTFMVDVLLTNFKSEPNPRLVAEDWYYVRIRWVFLFPTIHPREPVVGEAMGRGYTCLPVGGVLPLVVVFHALVIESCRGT